MGDAGALFLGLLMAAATMEIGGRTEGVSGQTYFFYAPLFLPLFILGVPISDMAFAYIRRMAKGTGIDTPDNDHVHHRLVRLGHGPRRTVVILWTWTAALSGFVLFPLFAPESNAIIPFAAVVLGLLLFTLFRPGLRSGRSRNDDDDDDAHAKAGAAETPGTPPVIDDLPTERVEPPSRNGAKPGARPASRIAAEPDDSGPRTETALG